MTFTGSNYIDFGTQTFGGTFSIAVLSVKTAVPAGNNPVFDFASGQSSDGVQLLYASSGLGPTIGYYDGRMYQSYIVDTTSIANGVWNHDVLVFEDVTNNAGRCSAAGASAGTSDCTIIAGYRNGQLIPTLAANIGNGFSGLNPVVKGFVGGQFFSLPKLARSGLYLGKSNWPQTGFVGLIADWQFFQDVALTAQNVSDLYSGALSVCT